MPLAQVEKLMLLQTGEKQEHGHILGLLGQEYAGDRLAPGFHRQHAEGVDPPALPLQQKT